MQQINAKNCLVDSIFISVDNTYERVSKIDILFVEALGSYVKVFTHERNFHITTHLKNFIDQLDDRNFLRISRKHLINTRKVNSIKGNFLTVEKHKLRIGITYKDTVWQQFPIIKTK